MNGNVSSSYGVLYDWSSINVKLLLSESFAMHINIV